VNATGDIINMSENYLEQLVSEWYEYKGYFIRRNVLVGKRSKGGYECELDIVAINPKNKHLIQIEPSMDTDSWTTRERRYKKKFEAGRKYIPQLFVGLDIPNDLEQIALLVYASKTNHKTLGGGKIVLINELLVEITNELKDKRLDTNAIPEHLTILRTFQFISHFNKVIT
jgi:hypothetical protein